MNIIRNRRIMFWSLAVALAFAVGLYVFFVQTTVYYRVEARGFSREGGRIAAATASFEKEYYVLSRGVNEKAARSQGFVHVSKVSFIKSVGAVTVNTRADD